MSTIAEPDDNHLRFDSLRAGFARAVEVAGSRDAHLELAGHRIRLRIAGDALAASIVEPFAHLHAPAIGESHLCIDMWDCRATGIPGLPATFAHVQGRSWDGGTIAASADGRFVSHALRGSVAWLDRASAHIIAWYADGTDLSLVQRAKPLQPVLALWASDRSLHAVHAALIGRGTRGVLLVGSGRAGKSTTAITCAQDDFTYAGDDWIALDGDGARGYAGHSLYCTATLEVEHARQFADLAPVSVAGEPGARHKCLLVLARRSGVRLARSLPVHALALPRVVDAADSRIRPATGAEALMAMIPSSVFTMAPRAGRRDVQRLFALCADLPAYWLEIGRDLRQIPLRVGDILGRGAAA